MLAGLGVQALWHSPRGRLRGVGLALTAVAGAYVVLSSWWVNAEHRADPRELLVSTQSSEEVRDVRDRVMALAAEREEPGAGPLTVTVDTAQGATFPWAWYFRDLESVGFDDLSSPASVPGPSDVLVLTEGSRQRLAGQLSGYDAERFAFRVWWVRDYGTLTPSTALDWIVNRDPWNPTGGMPEWLMVRRPA